MKISLFSFILLTLLMDACIGWVPIASSIRQIDNRSLRKSPGARLVKLRVQQHIPSAEDKVPSKPSPSASPSSITDYQKRTPIIGDNLWKNEENPFGIVSPELLGAGVIAGLIAVATSLSTAKTFDWR